MDYAEENMHESSSDVTDKVFYVIENYGWYVLASCIIFVVIYYKIAKHYVDNYLDKYRQHKFEQEYSAKYHKNPDLFAAHVNAQQLWAERMQEKYNKESEEYQKKIKEREERKKQEYIEKYGKDEGHVLGGKKDENNSNNLKPGYNPLMGGGSSSTYRPPRRSPCGGGGCGR